MDSDDDIYAVDDDIEQQRPASPSHAAASSSTPLDLSSQGYSQSRGRGKLGYSQVAAPPEEADEGENEPDGGDLELGGGGERQHEEELEEEFDHSTELSTLQTQR